MAIYPYCIPQYYYDTVFEIPYEQLKKQGKTTLFFDLDNTIMSYDQKELEPKYVTLIKELEKTFHVVIVSNSGYSRVSHACMMHDIPFIHSARKPLKLGYKKALKVNRATSDMCVFIGDQMMTDVLGSNRMGMTSILVKPVKQKTDHILTRINRKIEKQMIKKIMKKIPNKVNEALKKHAKDIHQL